MKNILVVGGAGYIGSHVVRLLNDKHKYNVIVLDNLSEGHKEAVKNNKLFICDINDKVQLSKALFENKIDAVMHFAAFAYVGESVIHPEKYYINNVTGTLNLLSEMIKNNIKNMVFSSTCATYGNPIYLPIDEKHPQNPINPYGTSKLFVEKILSDYSISYGLNYLSLRYFNAAGAHPDGSIGESHKNETHLIPLVLKTLTKEKENINIYGTDYDTKDGTCVRDYIHVCDLAEAHVFALDSLFSGSKNTCVNLGTGVGISVKEIIKTCEEITGMKVPVLNEKKRTGDPPILLASNAYSEKILNFIPKYDIYNIIETAWNWEKNKKY